MHISVVKWSVSRAGKPPALNLQHWRKTDPSRPPFKEETAGARVHFTVKKKIVDLGNNHYGIKVQLLFSGYSVFIWEMEMEFFP